MKLPALIVTVILLGGCAVGMGVETEEPVPHFLLITRERLRPGSEGAYDKNELQIAAACATLRCPHPYLALKTIVGPTEVWWLNAFVTKEQRDGVNAAYARNEALMTAMQPLAKRKEDFREALTTTMTTYRSESSGNNALHIARARFVVVTTRGEATPGAVFESEGGERFVMASAKDRAMAEALAARLGPEAFILAVQPQWSFPAQAWIDADAEFWRLTPRVE